MYIIRYDNGGCSYGDKANVTLSIPPSKLKNITLCLERPMTVMSITRLK